MYIFKLIFVLPRSSVLFSRLASGKLRLDLSTPASTRDLFKYSPAIENEQGGCGNQNNLWLTIESVGIFVIYLTGKHADIPIVEKDRPRSPSSAR